MKYSKEQQKAINTIDGQVCIISVAGSGKTSVIVARANNIIKSGVRPYRILVLTFPRRQQCRWQTGINAVWQ